MLYRPNSIRAVVGMLAFCGVLFAPWWVPAVCMAFLCLRYEAWEVPLIGMWADMLWLPAIQGGFPLFTLFGIVAVWAAMPIRRQLLL